MKKVFPFLVVLFVAGNAYAFDNASTHRELTVAAVGSAKVNLDAYLDGNLNLSGGVATVIKNVSIRELLREGSYLEDKPGCRASNHFHNPLRDWDESGMRDQPGFLNWWCSGRNAGYPAPTV